MPTSDSRSTGQRLPNRFTGWRVFGLLVGSVVLLLATLVVRENITGRRAVEKARQRWADAGFPLDPDRYRPAPVPDEENFAAVPSLYGILEDDEDGPSRTALPKLERLYALYGKIRKMPLNAWDPNRCDSEPDWFEWLATLENPKGPAATPPTPPPKEDAERAAAEAVFHLLNIDQPLIDEWTAALDLPRSQFVTPPPHRGGEPYYPWFVTTEISLRLQSRAALRAGLKPAATVRLLAMARLRDALLAERSYAAIDLGGDLNRGMQRVVVEGIAARRWDEPSLARLAPHLLLDVDPLLPVAAALDTVGWDRTPNTAFQSVMADRILPDKCFRLTPFIPGGVWDHNRATMLNLGFEHFLQPARRGGARGLWEDRAALEKAINVARTAPGKWKLRIHPHALLADTYRELGEFTGAFTFSPSLSRLVSLAVAVERFRLAEGHLPDAAAELVPRFLPAVPLDVDGQPLRFQKKGDGFLIYSVGDDGVDSWHGVKPPAAFPRCIPPPMRSALPAGYDADWVLDFTRP